MPKFGPRMCQIEDCSAWFIPTGPAAKYCPICAEQVKLSNAARNTQNYRIRNGLVQRPGVGKGGNNAKGEEDSQHKNGMGYFMSIRGAVRIKRRYCERCNKDLISVGRYEWVVHHRDHDRSNNVDENFELLCKRCHQIEHECHKAFEGAEVIP